METITYDAAGNIAGVTDAKNGSTLTSYSYTYDKAANPTTIVVNGQNDTLTYDARNRLTKVCYGNSCSSGEITYSYDGVGNRTSMTTGSGTTNSTYNADNELTSVSGATSTNYTYNADGERTSAASVTYAWNAAGELKSATRGSSTATYTYDGDGVRATSTTGSSTIDYLYDVNGSLPTLALEESGSTVLDRYLWADGLLMSAHLGSSDYYIAHDAQGSVVGVTSASGGTEATYAYDPFGNIRSSTTASGAPAIPLGYGGQLLDPTGLYYLLAREMDPTTGTFLSGVPISPDPTIPLDSASLYVDDEPTVAADPSGESLFSDVKSGVESYVEGTVGSIAHLSVDIPEQLYDCISNGTSSTSCRGANVRTGTDAVTALVGVFLPPVGLALGFFPGETTKLVAEGESLLSEGIYNLANLYFNTQNEDFYSGALDYSLSGSGAPNGPPK